MAFLGLQVFLLVTGIFYVLGVFFYSRDMSALIPLPVRPWQVLGAKFAVVLAYEYLMALPVLLPPMIIYGVRPGHGDALLAQGAAADGSYRRRCRC